MCSRLAIVRSIVGTFERRPPPSLVPEPVEEPREITVVMNGDMLLHEGLWATAEIDAARTGRGARRRG